MLLDNSKPQNKTIQGSIKEYLDGINGEVILFKVFDEYGKFQTLPYNNSRKTRQWLDKPAQCILYEALTKGALISFNGFDYHSNDFGFQYIRDSTPNDFKH